MKIVREKREVFFNKTCLNAFERLKEKLILSPIIVSLDWTFPFEVMCKASGMTI